MSDNEALIERAYEVVHHDADCPAIDGNGDADCACDAVPFLRDLKATLSRPSPRANDGEVIGADRRNIVRQYVSDPRDVEEMVYDLTRLASLSPVMPAVAGEGDAEQCHRCGAQNPSWHAPSPLWNAVMRGGSINGESLYEDMVCATCFMTLAEKAGIAALWRVRALQVNVPLELTTPSGRVWDEELFLWVEPAPSPMPEGVGASKDWNPFQYDVEAVILRRIREDRVEGYTLEMAKEIAALRPDGDGRKQEKDNG